MRGQAAERRAQAKRPFSVGDSVEFEREDRVELGVVERTADGTVEVWFHGQRPTAAGAVAKVSAAFTRTCLPTSGPTPVTSGGC